jgi:hypothetical protein
MEKKFVEGQKGDDFTPFDGSYLIHGKSKTITSRSTKLPQIPPARNFLSADGVNTASLQKMS